MAAAVRAPGNGAAQVYAAGGVPGVQVVCLREALRRGNKEAKAGMAVRRRLH